MSTTASAHNRWFCHACQFHFNQPLDLQDPECTSCRSSFVEELEPPYPPPLSRWTRSDLADSIPDDSPPIPSTRQRYEQQQQQNSQPSNRHQNPQIPFINFIDPLISILSAPAIPDPPDHQSPPTSSPHARPQNRPNPPSFSSIGEFFAQHYSPPNFTPSTSFTNRPTGNNENTDDQTRTSADSNPSSSPNPPLQGVYTLSFGSQPSTPIPPDLDPTHDHPTNRTSSEDQPRESEGHRIANDDRFSFGTAGNLPQQPLQGFLSLLQSAFGLNPGNSSNNAATAENDRRAEASNNSDSRQTNESSMHEQTSTSSAPGGNRTEMNEDQPMPNSPPRHSRPTARSPRVNVEESHPLRQFINILNSLNQSDGSISRNGVNGFVINGGAGFGFTTQFDMDQNVPFGQNLGDYVTSDSTMQDILNQLINMTGANGAHNPIPASESTIKSLKRFKFDTASTVNEEPIECAICKDTFAVDDACMELPCKHFFHDEGCILPWLKQNGTCPVCRYSLVNNANSESSQRTDGDSNNSEQPRMGTEGGEAAMNSNHLNRSSSHDPSPNQPQSSNSSNWTDDWEVDQLEPQFDFD